MATSVEPAGSLHSPQSLDVSDGDIHVELTPDHLDVSTAMTRVKHPSAGAIVIFAGTTRDNFHGKPVKRLSYSAYAPLALNTMLRIAADVHKKHGLVRISMVHRLGKVPVGEESILVCVSAPHRGAAWRAGEESLEECKGRVEVWKCEEFEEGGVWKANRDGGDGGDGGDRVENEVEREEVEGAYGGDG